LNDVEGRRKKEEGRRKKEEGGLLYMGIGLLTQNKPPAFLSGY
jgi:hypothetical protein